MAKLPNLKRILREDVKEAPNWIERIITPVNSFFESVYYALNKNITFSENIACQIKEIEFETLSDYTTSPPDNWEIIKFAHTLRTKPQGVLLLQIYEVAGTYNPIVGGVYIDWIEVNGEIQINYITGLENSKTYKIRVLVV